MLAEEARLEQSSQRTANWQRWGPYLSERQWGTVREDYSENGDCWNYFPHEHARSRAYRWGEDGLLGICDRECRLCFGLALWNGKDPILKERLFGLTGPEGNHGEDVKEAYFYLDSTPTHSYMKGLYKYPQAEFPYDQLVQENRRRNRLDPEFELSDTGVFNDSRYFDVVAEYAKGSPDDLLIRITIANRADEAATIHLLPTLWFRNTWTWASEHDPGDYRPSITRQADGTLLADHPTLGRFLFTYCGHPNQPGNNSNHDPEVLFTENETNAARLYGADQPTTPAKDAFHDYVISGNGAALNPTQQGTKAAPHYVMSIPAHQEVTFCFRLSADTSAQDQLASPQFERILAQRLAEADEFYAARIPASANREEHAIARQAYAGLLWSKQFYHYSVESWLNGDPGQPVPPVQRKSGRNSDWPHLFNRDVISMPDKWEYPWYAAWDLAFHMIPMAVIDPGFAKSQLLLMLREWYMHPSGQIPAYEFAFSDVNPPVHAWACWRVYKMTGQRGERDRDFLARAFQKLLINFTWWINRKDVSGKHLFSGGFLGLDNIGVFDRSKPLPHGGLLEQADGTAWMAFYCATMLAIALELAQTDPTYEDVASKFFEHFVHIADAMNCLGGSGLWDEADGFYYDQLQANGETYRMKIRSIVGVIPLFAVEVLEDELLQTLPGFRKRLEWFLKHRKDLASQISYMQQKQSNGDLRTRRLLAIPSKERLQRVLHYVLDEREFLSPCGVRGLSRVHADQPFILNCGADEQRVEYVPAESTSSMFGGNSNWRGPIWFPVNYLLIESLERFHHFYGNSFTVECPTGSGRMLTLQQVAHEISQRLSSLFLPDSSGRRPCHGDDPLFANDPNWRNLVLFYEYFHGDNGRGVGASHQTGWTALIARLIGGQCSASTHHNHKSDPKEANPAGETLAKPASAIP